MLLPIEGKKPTEEGGEGRKVYRTKKSWMISAVQNRCHGENHLSPNRP
jgi:hypothetical protein